MSDRRMHEPTGLGLIPMVIEQSGRRRACVRHLLEAGQGARHFLVGPVDDVTANLVVAQMLFLESENPTRTFTFYINSPGGSVSAGMAIFDTMQFIKPDVSTLCVGMAASMGAFLLAAGTKGKRFALPNSTVMIHQPSGGFQGQVSDIERHAQYAIELKRRFIALMVQLTGRSTEQVEQDHDATAFLRQSRPWRTELWIKSCRAGLKACRVWWSGEGSVLDRRLRPTQQKVPANNAKCGENRVPWLIRPPATSFSLFLLRQEPA